MPDFKIDSRDVFFILKEQLDYGRLITLAPFRDLNEKSLDLLVNEAIRFAKGVLDPLNAINEKRPAPMGIVYLPCPSRIRRTHHGLAADRYGRDCL